jgi:hypothetical protein
MTSKLMFITFTFMLSGCGNPDCNMTEATGLFEIFKTEGCGAVVDVSLDPSKGAQIHFSHSGNVTLVDGIDTVSMSLIGRLYTGRRGTCVLHDGDTLTDDGASGHCDYVVRSFTKVSEKESRYTVEILDAYMSVYGNQGTMKGVVSASAFNQGFSP